MRRVAWSIAVCLVLAGAASSGFAQGAADHAITGGPGVEDPVEIVDLHISGQSRMPVADDLEGMIAFEVGGRIATMRADGSDRVTVSTGPGDLDPHWSPDGSAIVFRATRDVFADPYGIGFDGIRVVDLVSGEERQVAAGGGLFPTWTPDGDVLYSGPGPRERPETLIVFDLDTGLARDLGVYGEGVHWSRDGSTAAVDRLQQAVDHSPGQNWEVWRMSADASELSRLTDSPGDDFAKGWAPAGERIAFTSPRGGDNDVWTMAADGSDAQVVIDWPGSQSAEGWLLDGRILFVDYRRGGRHVDWYVVRPDGSDIRRVSVLEDVNPPIDWR
jgi:Tol biopolymer transport system component